MMRIIKKMLKQRAVYWAPKTGAGGLDRFGKRLFEEPIEVNCRWHDVEKEFLDEDGNKRMSMAKAWLASDVLVLGVLWLSSVKASASPGAALAEIDQTDTLNPFLNDKAYEIRKFGKIPTLPATQIVRVAWM